jgi:glycine betaine/proline transport system substrate-binding protein
MKQLIGAALTAGALLSGAQAFAADCGKVVIGEMNWASGEFLARLDGFILSEGYGCEVEYLTAGTVPQITSMNEKGTPDFASELWANSAVDLLKQASKEGRLTKLNKKPFEGAGETWFVNGNFAKNHPELKTIQDIIERPDLFPHPEDPSKGGLHTCPPGWACELSTNNLFRAFDMEAKGWKLVQTGSGAGLDGSIAKSSERGENWIGYYWAPTTMVGKYNLQPIDWNTGFDADNWNNCIVKPEEECENPKPSSYTFSEVVSLAQNTFVEKNPEPAKYIEQRVFDLPLIGKYLSYMDANQATGEDAAIEFLLNEESTWTQWVTADVAAKVKNAL